MLPAEFNKTCLIQFLLFKKTLHPHNRCHKKVEFDWLIESIKQTKNSFKIILICVNNICI